MHLVTRLSLTLLSIFVYLSFSAQEILFEEDFESYTLGSFIAEQSNNFQTFNPIDEGGYNDGTIINNTIGGTGQCLFLAAASNLGSIGSVLLPLSINSGSTEVTFDIWMESPPPGASGGLGANIRILKTPYPSSQILAETIFAFNDLTILGFASTNGNGTTVGSSSYNGNQVYPMKILFYRDAGFIEFYFDQNLVGSYTMQNDNDILGSIHFYEYANGIDTGRYGIDNIVVKDITELSAHEEEVEAALEIYPSILAQGDALSLRGNAASGTVQIYSMSGELLVSHALSGDANESVPLPQLAVGMYIATVETEKGFMSQKVIVE